MTVETRSQTTSKMTTRSANKDLVLSPKKAAVPKKKAVLTSQEPDELHVTFLTQEEYNAAGYIDSKYGGCIRSRLVAACIPAIYNSEEDDIAYEPYIEDGYKRPQDKIYVVAPDGYYWDLKHRPYAGWMYSLERI